MFRQIFFAVTMIWFLVRWIVSGTYWPTRTSLFHIENRDWKFQSVFWDVRFPSMFRMTDAIRTIFIPNISTKWDSSFPRSHIWPSILLSLHCPSVNTFYLNPLSLIPSWRLPWNVRYFPLPTFVLIWKLSNFFPPALALPSFLFLSQSCFFFFILSFRVFLFRVFVSRPYSSGKFFTPTVFNLREGEKLSKSENSCLPLSFSFFRLFLAFTSFLRTLIEAWHENGRLTSTSSANLARVIFDS